jgi:hypothetical protein
MPQNNSGIHIAAGSSRQARKGRRCHPNGSRIERKQPECPRTGGEQRKRKDTCPNSKTFGQHKGHILLQDRQASREGQINVKPSR